MERRIRRLGIALVVLFAIVFGQLAYVQVFAADDIKNHPANFSRQLIAEYNVQRGKILTSDGLVLAESVPAIRTRATATSAGTRRATSTATSPATTRGSTAIGAGAVDEPVPVRRGARARDLHVRRPVPRATPSGAQRPDHDRLRPPGGRPGRDGGNEGAVVAIEPAHRGHPRAVRDAGVRSERVLQRYGPGDPRARGPR